MKLFIKSIAFIIIFLFIYLTAFCQYPTREEFFKNKAYDGYELVDTTHASPQQMARIHRGENAKLLTKDHYYYDSPFFRNLGVRFTKTDNTKSEIYEGLNWGPDDSFKSILIDGNCGVEFSALDVNEKNAADYRYHVVQNNEIEIVTWAKPNVFKYTADGKYKYAYLGKFDYVPGQVLKVEIYNVHDYRHLDAFMIDWRKVERANLIGHIDYYSARFHPPDNGLFSKFITDLQQTTESGYRRENKKLVHIEHPISVKDFIETTNKNNIKFRADDSVRNLGFIIHNGGRSYKYKVSLKRETAENKDSINLGEVNDKFDLNKEFWKTYGKYKITFTPKIHRHGGQPIYLLRNLATSISFTVLPPGHKLTNIPINLVVYIILILLTTGGFMFMMYRRRQNQKLVKEAQNKQIATLQLQGVRAQLNPHFIFNALAGVQNLMNKNEVENANKYLARFARLTRNILDDGQKELTTIEHEAAILTDYLQMEQMRFGFKFNFDINEGEIDQQIEIPAMLLQPFVENAIKHGVSSLKNEGMVIVSIKEKDTDIILSVKDNGKGFSTKQPGGMGIKLCEERIKLLNSIYKNTSILLHINSDSKGTLITIELKNWL